MEPVQPGTISFNEVPARAANEIGHLERWPVHLFVVLSEKGGQLQLIQRAGCGTHSSIGKMQVQRGLFQIAMAEKKLNGAQVGARFQQMSSKAVPARCADESHLPVQLVSQPDGKPPRSLWW